MFRLQVTIGGAPCDLIFRAANHRTLVCLLPPGQGTNRAVRVTVASRVSSSLNFNYDPPNLIGISPSNGPTLGKLTFMCSNRMCHCADFLLFQVVPT